MAESDKEREQKLLTLLQSAIEQDKLLRDKYKVGDKFRFIRDRLQALCGQLEEKIKTTEQAVKKAEKKTADEILVYVYLYNSQGVLFPTWQKMITVGVLYEYSVNRPIYSDKSMIESYIRSKTNKTQHAYLTVAIKPTDIISLANVEVTKDAIGAPLVKVREGSILINKLVLFTHNDHEYNISESGALTKKQD